MKLIKVLVKITIIKIIIFLNYTNISSKLRINIF